MKFTLTEKKWVDGKLVEVGTSEVDVDYTQKELDEEDKLWCKCDYLDKNKGVSPQYVEKYMGVNHGWICPKCKKFVQIG